MPHERATLIVGTGTESNLAMTWLPGWLTTTPEPVMACTVLTGHG